MKNNIAQFSVLFIVFTALLLSCKKDDSNNSPIDLIVTTGTWKVSYYHENNEDKTSNFSDYTFTFGDNGTMTASNSGGTTTGTWTSDDSENEIHISLGNTEPLKDLSKGWLIISKSSTEIVLKDDDITHLEELHFTIN